MNRRSFFGGLGAIVSGGALSQWATPDRISDCFTYHGWAVMWSGWREPANQNIRIGWWEARAPDGYRRVVATTLGHCGSYRGDDMIDTMIYDREAPRTPFDPPEKFTEAKRLAHDRLLQHLDLV